VDPDSGRAQRVSHPRRDDVLDLFSKRLLVVSGKGGVGKTVVSSALALLASRQGKNVLLIKMDDQGRTSQLFGTPPLGDRVMPLREGISAVNLDPKTVAYDWILSQLKIKRLVRHIVDSRLFDSWFRVSPAIKEMISLGKVASLVDERTWWRKDPVWDLVIFDAPATGHGLGLLRLPEQASKLLIGPLRKNALAVQALLENPTLTSLVLVTIPEEMPVNEVVHFYEEAKKRTQVTLSCLILNAAFPRRVQGAEPSDLGAAFSTPAGEGALRALLGGRVGASEARASLLRAAEWSQVRGALTERYRGELNARVGLPLLELPSIFAEQFGFAELEQVAACLGEALAAPAAEPVA
jgi:anion-transporting  ArsA/GET3 family ATPase